MKEGVQWLDNLLEYATRDLPKRPRPASPPPTTTKPKCNHSTDQVEPYVCNKCNEVVG